MTTTSKKKRMKSVPVERPSMTKQEKQELKAIIDAAYGCLAGMNYSVDEYLREKYGETERENETH